MVSHLVLGIITMMAMPSLCTSSSLSSCTTHHDGDHDDDIFIPRIDTRTMDPMDIIAQATADLWEYGVVVLEHVVETSTMEHLAADLDVEPSGYFFGTAGSFAGTQTKRKAGKPLGDSTIAQELAVHNWTTSIVTNMLQPYSKRVILGTATAITVVGPQTPNEPAAPAQTIHRDDSMWASEWITNMACRHQDDIPETERFPQLSVSAMWAISDFTDTNGATQVAPYSHKQCPRTFEAPANLKTKKATMSSGSVLIWAGGTFHGATAAEYNPESAVRDTTRRGLIFIYNLGILRSEHNFHNALPREVMDSFSPALRSWIGYQGTNAVSHPWYSGPVYAQPYLGGPPGLSSGNGGAVTDDALYDTNSKA